jgi:MscS family membrane protein
VLALGFNLFLFYFFFMFDGFVGVLNNFFPGTYFGVGVGEYALFFLTVLVSLVVGKIFYFFMKNYVRRITAKTKTELDDIFVDIVEEPLVFVIFVVGLYVGFLFLEPGFSVAIPWFVEFFHKVIGMLVISAIAWFLLRFIDAFLDHYVVPLAEKTESKLDDQIVPIVRKVGKIAVLAVAGIIVLDNFGYNVTALIAGLGIGGLAFAFAAQKTIANVFGGATIFVDKSFFVGERIQVNGIDGVVEKIGLRTTRIKDFDNFRITIPNSNIADSTVTNVSRAENRRIKFTLNLVYGTSVKQLRKAVELIKKAVADTKGTAPEKTKVVFNEFAGSSLDLLVLYYLNDNSAYFSIKDEVNFRIKEYFEKAGLEFAYPTQTVYVEK